jgi:hypothetical protein
MSEKWTKVTVSSVHYWRLPFASWTAKKGNIGQLYLVPTANIIDMIGLKYNFQFLKDDDQDVETDLCFWVMDKYVFKANNNDWDNVTNAFFYNENHGNYSITPRPESTTTLYTPYNIQARFIMADNLESHIANLNDISGSVQILNMDVEILQAEVNKIESQIQQLAKMLEVLSVNLEVMQITMIAGAVFSFGATAASIIGDAGIDLAEAESVISFGEDGLLSMDADGN